MREGLQPARFPLRQFIRRHVAAQFAFPITRQFSERFARNQGIADEHEQLQGRPRDGDFRGERGQAAAGNRRGNQERHGGEHGEHVARTLLADHDDAEQQQQPGLPCDRLQGGGRREPLFHAEIRR